jgi:hypothetical protein
MRLRWWRMADKARWLRTGALVFGAAAVGIALAMGVAKRIARRLA